MTATNVSFEQLQRVHHALRITIPLHQVSPLMLSTLTAIAHCWRDRIQAHLWDRPTDATAGAMPQEAQQLRRHASPAAGGNKHHPIDLKRLAAADYE